MTTLHNAFCFVGDFDQTVYDKCPYGTQALKDKVTTAHADNLTYLNRFKRVRMMSSQVADGGRTFKVLSQRKDFHTDYPNVPKTHGPGWYP